VVPLKNAEAAKLAITLRALVAAESASTDPTNTNIQGNPNLSALAPMNANQGGASPMNIGGGVGGANSLGGGPSAAATTALTSSSTPSTGGIIQADPNTNSLIITASEPVFNDLMKVIALLDRRRAQVYIESIIVELSDANAAELGVQWQALNSSNTAFAGTNFTGPTTSGNTNIIGASAAINAVLGAAAAGTAAPAALGLGLNIGSITTFGNNLAFSSLLRAISTISGSNVLSTPNLMTLDNEEARIVVGENIPIVTGSYAQTGSTSTVTPFQTFTRQDVGLTLRVRPQVSDNGTVKLQIFQEVSSIQSGSSTTGYILNKRNVESNVIVEDGQIIVLGGLIGDNYTDGSSKIPFLGDLPLIGGLFRYDNKSRKRTNLMVFIRPSVLRNNEQNNIFSNNKLDDFEEKRKSFSQVPLFPKNDNLNTASLRDIRDIMHNIAP
jgi:general secretion pathway protein D